MKNVSKAGLWKERLVECRRSGLTVIEYCRRNSIPTKSYYYWKLRLAASYASISAGEPTLSGAAPTAWLCIEPSSSASPCPRASLTVRVSGAEIEVGTDFNPGLLRAVVEALRVQQC
jgi:hypothetical protein